MITYRVLVIDDSVVSVEPGAIHKESVYVDSIFGCFFNVLWVLCFHHLETELEPVNRNLVLTSVRLQTTSHKALREEHSWHPERFWCSLLQPVIHELNALSHVDEPTSERFE